MEKSLRNMFKDKRVLVTGHTGFKGSWLCIWLKELGAEIVGYALEPNTEKDNFVVTGLADKITHITGNIKDFDKLRGVFALHQPEFVFHLAAQPIVRESYAHPKETYDVNIGGTVNVLECCRLEDSVKVIINVTSDKCYENREWIWGYRENDPMGGHDPYSSSKGCSELITRAYRDSFFASNEFEAHRKCLSSVRAGNVIGGGDWQQDRIVPDCIRALSGGNPIEVRNPTAIRPWQHVLEPLSGYLLLASRMYKNPQDYSGAWNFGPDHNSFMTVGELVEKIVIHWGHGKWKNPPHNKQPHETNLLNLDSAKAKAYLKWFPVWDMEKTIEKTVEWYKMYRREDPFNLCVSQIESFQFHKKRGQDGHQHSPCKATRRICRNTGDDTEFLPAFTQRA
ncbi:MAG: CDP-glucose 4,6-dehydratase [Thermodesulfobacteriota bacterium]|nr:CDP-glucose 4,6-dehydratase [Thermodesulfobacteriota bacterium]